MTEVLGQLVIPVDTHQPSPEREQTDESLHDERENESTVGQGTCVTFTVPTVAHQAAPAPLGGHSPTDTPGA